MRTAARTGSTAGLARPAGAAARSIRLRDGLLGILVVVAHLAPVRTGQAADLTAAWAGLLVMVCALGSGVCLLWRRTHPRLVTVVVLVCYLGFAVVQGLVPPYAAWVLIWSLATSRGPRRQSVAFVAGTAAATCLLLVGAELSRPGVGAVAFLVGVTALITLTAVLARSERARIEAVGRRAATEERLRIARDLHDLVGHGLSTIAVQSSTARMALEADDRATAGRALSAVESSSRTAMREMRQMLGVLTDEEAASTTVAPASRPARHPSPGLADIAALVDNVRAGGVAVTLQRSGAWEGATSAAQLVAYRVVQEGLTNAVKHAPGAVVAVSLTTNVHGQGTVSVETSGTATPPAHDNTGATVASRGLDGLRTRVTAIDGQFACGPTHQGWLVQARLPLSDEAGP